MKLPNPLRFLRELSQAKAANELLVEQVAEFKITMEKLRSTVAAEQAEIRALKTDREKDLDTLNAMAEERDGLIGQIEELSAQYYNWAGPPMEEGEPLADEGANIVCFTSRLKTRH